MELSKKAWKILSRWAADGLYVYIRPTSTKWYRPSDDHRLFWGLTVEFRNIHWIIWDAKGDNLDLIIRTLGEQIPRRVKLHEGFIPADEEGTQISGSSFSTFKKNKVYIKVRESGVDGQPGPKPPKRLLKDKKRSKKVQKR